MTTRADRDDARLAARGRVAYRVGFARGLLALTLGLAMVVQPEKTSDNLATYMGAFWALAGVVSIRAALAGERMRGVPLVSGCAGVVAGIVVLFHERLDDVVAQSVLVSLLAIVILLTGLAHVLSGFKTGDELERQCSRLWALTGGVILIGDALLLRRRLRSQNRLASRNQA